MRLVHIVLSLTTLSILVGCKTKTQTAGQEPVPVEAESVVLQQVRPNWTYSGEIRPQTEVQLAFKEAGYVASLYRIRGTDGRMRDVQEGDEIPVGAVLAHLRSSDYEASLSAAAGQQHAMQGVLEASEADLNRAEADRIKVNSDFARAQALYAAHALTRPDYDAAVEQHTAAAATVNAALRQIEAHRGQVNAAQGQTDSARINLGDTRLAAPMPGELIEKSVERGSLVAAGTTVFKLDDTRTVKVSFGVPDTALGYLKLGAELPVRLDVLSGRTLTGKITEIAGSANRESRVFNVEVSLPNQDRSLKVGMIANVRVERGDAQAVPVVPMTALMTAQSGSTNYSVFTVREQDGRQFARLASVRIGDTSGKSVVIDEGLTPGERIIVNRTNQLSDGSAIRVVNQEVR